MTVATAAGAPSFDERGPLPCFGRERLRCFRRSAASAARLPELLLNNSVNFAKKKVSNF
jgi:hypothetical protein